MAPDRRRGTGSLTVLGIHREQIYSNHAVEADRRILELTLEQVERLAGGRLATTVREPHEELPDADLILSMAQHESVLGQLQSRERQGIPVINSVASIRNCYRVQLSTLLTNGAYPQYAFVKARQDLAFLPFESPEGYWLKRGDFHALTDDDVVYAQDLKGINGSLRYYRSHGIEDVVLQRHVEGPIIKFYGVADGFFRHRAMPSRDPGKKRLAFPPAWSDMARVEDVRAIAAWKAGILGLTIYGGDCIVDRDGKLWVIDMNDWPAFRTCQDEAATSIARLAVQALAGHLGLEGVEPSVCRPSRT
jgi:hypothetical protein